MQSFAKNNNVHTLYYHTTILALTTGEAINVRQRPLVAITTYLYGGGVLL